jgi:circadian clock protein KaiB
VSDSSEPQAAEGEPAPARLQLSLFVSGASPISIRAVQRLRALCDKYCPEGYDLKIIDIYQQPDLATSARVLAVPTLIKEGPHPVRRLVGDFSNEPRVLAALGLSTVMDA